MLKQRIITAAILIPILLFAIFYSTEGIFELGCGIVILYAAWEWTLLMGLKKLWVKGAFLLLMFVLVLIEEFLQPKSIYIVALFWWFLATLWIMNYPKLTRVWSSKFILTILGVEVLLPCWMAIVMIRELYSPFTLLYLLCLVWAADTGGYFVGRALGRHKLAPKVSPVKTIEGVMGGITLSVITAVCFGFWFAIPSTQWAYWLLLAAATAVISVIGDLLISMLKRNCGLKDTGAILPGHGGLLDRIDSLTAAGPLFALGLLLLNFKLA